MKFSVVIPAHNEEKRIGQAITALKKQNVPRSEFEIIVVDNNSTDNTRGVAENVGADKVLLEKKRGTNLARQRGFEESRGEIVAFLDADCEPPPDWLKKIESNLRAENVAAVSGPYDYGFQWIKKITDKFYTGFLFKYLDKILYFLFRKKAGVIIGGNFAAPRWVIEKIGGIPPLQFYGDDAAIAMLVARKVGRVVFDSALRVKSSPRRFEKEGFLKVNLNYIKNYLKIYFSGKI